MLFNGCLPDPAALALWAFAYVHIIPLRFLLFREWILTVGNGCLFEAYIV